MLPTSTPGVINQQSAYKTGVALKKPRYFFVAMALVFIIIAAVGFGPNIQAIRSGVSKPPWVVHLHGAVMTGWLLLFLIQSMLVAKKNVQLHRRLGLFSFAWGIAVFIVMLSATLHMIFHFHPPEEDFLFDLIMMAGYGLITFTSFFVGGVITRKKNPAAHKRFLVLATTVILQAAIDRIHFLPMFGLQYPGVYFIYLDLLFLPLMVYDLVSMRRIHGVTWKGAVFVVLVQCSIVTFFGAPGWHKFWFNATLPLMDKRIEVQPLPQQIEALEGQYGNKNFSMQVLSDKGNVYLNIAGQPRYAMGATSDTTWFFRTINPTVTFRKDASGKVTKMIFTQGYADEEYPKLP